ncbi:hypothetical protein, partial [Escherichia coli]|uniref:hypothetical protein n=1 Tax=Escherichia coli TaxID=562 RepID=UPI001BFCABDE
ILLRQKQKKLIMLPSETMIWQPEFTDKTLSRKPGAVQSSSLEWIFGREKDFIWTLCSSFLLLIINNSRLSSAFNNGL